MSPLPLRPSHKYGGDTSRDSPQSQSRRNNGSLISKTDEIWRICDLIWRHLGILKRCSQSEVARAQIGSADVLGSKASLLGSPRVYFRDEARFCSRFIPLECIVLKCAFKMCRKAWTEEAWPRVPCSTTATAWLEGKNVLG